MNLAGMILGADRKRWSPRRLRTVYPEIEAAIASGVEPSPDTLAALSQFGTLPPNLRADSATQSGRVIGHLMTTVLGRGALRWGELDRLISSLPKRDKDGGHARELLAYLKIVQGLNDFIVETDLAKRPQADFVRHAGDLLRIVDRGARAFPGARALTILRAGVISLDDRSAARSLYREAIGDGPGDMASSIYDLGAHSYFDAAEVAERRRPATDDDRGRTTVKQALAARPAPYDRAWFNLVWSVDVGFLRIYGPYWFNLAPYLMNEGVGMVMIVVGPPDETALAIDQARDLIARTARFHKLPDAEAYAMAFSFVPMPLPPNVGEAKTFYASARYLLAGAIIAETGAPVLVLDADQTARNPITPFVRGLRRATIALPRTRGIGVLWPWRRIMANTGWFTAAESSLAVLSHVGDYVSVGLPQPISWTLDQNALAYALETAHGARMEDLSEKVRPLYQEKVRLLFEKTWRDGPQPPP